MANTQSMCTSFMQELMLGQHQFGSASLTSRGSLTAPTADTFKAALYFASNSMKTDDHWFRGFPATWNLVVFLLLAIEPPVVVTVLIVIAAAIGQASSFVFVHPVRVKMLRPLTLTLMVVWSAAGIWAIAQDMKPDVLTQWVLGLIGVYFVGLGLLRKGK